MSHMEYGYACDDKLFSRAQLCWNDTQTIKLIVYQFIVY
jgi:hypothetical protein